MAAGPPVISAAPFSSTMDVCTCCDWTLLAPSALFVTTVPITLEAFLVPFADHLRADGWRVDALANGATTAAPIAEHFDRRFDVAWSRSPLSPRNLLGTSRRVREIVSAGHYNIIHVHTPIAAFISRNALRYLRRLPGGPSVIYTAHGFHFYRGQGAVPHAIFRTLERIAAPWTDYLVTVNREDFDAARALRGLPAERVRLIPGIGVDTERFSPQAATAEDAERIRAELGVPAGAFLLAMVAELAPVKRHAFVLDALTRVRDPRVVLALVGDGSLEEALRAEVARLGLSERVRFAGYRRDVPAVLRAADALVLASEREGLNRSVLEAMASGRPVIGTRTRGIADAVGDDGGWIVGKTDAAALAAAIDAAAADPEEVARRGAAARARAVAEYSLGRIIEAYDELYGEALASHV
jgi:glycosyltransferase involved in cell wall biosynthesis